ncbi:hypothetical protein BH11PSE6_BH11PSE6_16820 [soil metagenome]
MLVPQGALIFLLDGGHVEVLRNRSADARPDLEVVPVHKIRNGLARADMRNPGGLVGEVIAAVDLLLAAGTQLILVAPSNLLGELRSQVPKRSRRQIAGEVAGDLTGCGVRELADRLREA